MTSHQILRLTVALLGIFGALTAAASTVVLVAAVANTDGWLTTASRWKLVGLGVGMAVGGFGLAAWAVAVLP